MPINEDRYFVRLSVDLDEFKKDTIGLALCQFENKVMVTFSNEKGDLCTRWVLTEFIEKM